MSTTLETTFDRAAWLADRKKAIGASDVAAILGVSPYASPWDVWADKTNRVNEWEGNQATRLGNYFERSILDYAEDKLGKIERNKRVVHSELPIASTLDAQCVEDGRPIEAKTTGLAGPIYGDWGSEGTDEVPENYLVQVHTQLLCTGADLGYLFALVPGRGILKYEVPRNDSLLLRLGTYLNEWWQKHVIADVEPSREKASLEIVKRMKRTPSKIVDLPSTKDLERWERTKAIISRASKLKESYEAVLLASLGDAEAATFPDGRSMTYYETTRKGYVVGDSTYRTARVKKAKS